MDPRNDLKHNYFIYIHSYEKRIRQKFIKLDFVKHGFAG